MEPPKPIPRVPKTLLTRLMVLVAETRPALFACRKPEPVPRVRALVDAPPLKVWRDDQALALARSAALLTRQVPETEKQPEVRFTPVAKVDVAAVSVVEAPTLPPTPPAHSSHSTAPSLSPPPPLVTTNSRTHHSPFLLARDSQEVVQFLWEVPHH